MKKQIFPIAFFTLAVLLSVFSCTNPEKPFKPIIPPEPEEVLPTPLAEENYAPSLLAKPYKPIIVKAAVSNNPSSAALKSEKTRILAYLTGFEPAIKEESEYKSVTNKYGSRTDKGKHEATGRFYTKKIGDRWWIIDPEGYIHYQRSVTSLRPGSSQRNKDAWSARFGSNTRWMSVTQAELAEIGFHGTAAFCTNTYQHIQTHNQQNPDKPMTLAPSFGFLGQFRSQKCGGKYPGDDEANLAGLVFYPGWEAFCESYIRSALAPYLKDPNTLGFFSDNEINFSSGSADQNVAYLSWRFPNITDPDDPARKAVEEWMAENNITGKQGIGYGHNSKFVGEVVAEKYYSAVRKALDKINAENGTKLMYLGTRLHGTPKYMEHVVRAAGKYCDIVSINYYSRWSPELDTRVKDWNTWSAAPFMVTEFYTKAKESELANTSGAGMLVETHKDRAYAYQHFTLGLLEAPNCVGWHWFKYQDDDGSDNDARPANKGIYDNNYSMYPWMRKYMRALNYNVYELIEFFDGRTY